jgi:nucleotide-binding universal stress UspA family protein
VVARAALEGEPTSGSNEGRVVIGTDGSPVSEEALGFAFEEASWRAAGLTVVHAFDEEPGVLIDGDTGRSERERQAARTFPSR